MDDKQSKHLQIHVFTVCALSLFIDGYDLYVSSVAEPFINAMFHPSPFMIGLTQAAAPMGAALGALLAGRISDMIGRKSMLIFNLIFFILIAIMTSFAWNNTSLCVFRFLIGFGVGADYPICAAYLAEMMPKNKSAKLVASAMFINCLASPVGVLAAWLLFKLHPALDVWRWMFASGAVPALIGLLFRAKLPESFLWKAHHNLKTHQASFISIYKKLLAPDVAKMTLCMCSCWFLQDISYYGIGLFTPYVLNSLHFSSHSDLLSSAGDMLKSTLLVNIFVLLGAFSAIFAVDRINQLGMQKIGFLLSFIGLLMLSLSYMTSGTLNIMMIFSGFILFNFFINFGPGLTTYLMPAQFYQTHLRATGHGVASSAGKFGAFIGVIFLPVLQANVGIYATVGLLSITLLLALILTQLLSQTTLTHDSTPDIGELSLVTQG